MTDSKIAASAIDESGYNNYLKALLVGDRYLCADIIQDQLRQGVLVKTLYLDLMQRAMYEVGTLWERNLVSVATEHLASATTEMLLTSIYPMFFSEHHKDRRAIITCVPHEYHQIGPRMVADFFELHGWHGFTLGANTPTECLLRMIGERDPDVVGFSMSMSFNRPQLELMVAAVGEKFPRLELIVGGRAFQNPAGQESLACMKINYPRINYIDSLHSLESYLTRV